MPRPPVRRLLPLLAAVLALPAAAGPAPPAAAEPAAAQGAAGRAAARLAAAQTGGAVERAREALRAGRQDAAVAAYREALAADPGATRVRFELANVLAWIGRYPEASEEFGRVVAEDPKNAEAHRGRATAFLLQREYAEARRALERGLHENPRDGQIANVLARLLATAPEDGVRDGELAVEIATAVYEVVKIPATGETLAMAYAEAGDFERAVALQRKLVREAEAEGDRAQAESLRKHLLSFLRKEPWRAPDPTEIVLASPPPAPPAQLPGG